jgi:hypothetical protein
MEIGMIPNNPIIMYNKLEIDNNNNILSGQPIYNMQDKLVGMVSRIDENHIYTIPTNYILNALNKKDNTIFHGYLEENEIYHLAQKCFIGLSSGLSAIELSKLGLPVAVAKEDTSEMVLTCFTGNGYFIFQDDFKSSEDLDFMNIVETIYKSSANEWEEYSLKAKSICNDKGEVDVLWNINEIQVVSRKSNLILFINYLICIILDKLKFVKFNFIHRIK